MTLRSPSGVLAQPIHWLASHPGVMAVLVLATAWLRLSGASVTMHPVSETWLADLERRSMRSREY